MKFVSINQLRVVDLRTMTTKEGKSFAILELTDTTTFKSAEFVVSEAEGQLWKQRIGEDLSIIISRNGKFYNISAADDLQ